MSDNPATLGFYTLGVPVIFVRSDVLARLDKRIWDYPVQHQDPGDLKALKDLATLHHEVRHFHDALLTPFLFERFVMEVQRNCIGSLILGRLRTTGAEIASAEHIDNESSEMLALHTATLDSYWAKYQSFEGTFSIDALDVEISYLDLLETNALIAELCVVEREGGQSKVQLYWEYWKHKLPSRYTRLIELFSRRSDVFLDRITILHRAIVAALYSGNNPVREFENFARYGLLSTARHADQIMPAQMIRETIQRNLANEVLMFMGYEATCVGDEFSPEFRQGLSQVKDYFIFASELILARQMLLDRCASMRVSITNCTSNTMTNFPFRRPVSTPTKRCGPPMSSHLSGRMSCDRHTGKHTQFAKKGTLLEERPLPVALCRLWGIDRLSR